MDPFTFLIFALLSIAVALVVVAFMKAPRARRKTTIVPPRPMPAHPEPLLEFSPDHEQIRDALKARRSGSLRSGIGSSSLAHASHKQYPVTVDSNGAETYTPTFYLSSYPLPESDPSPSYSAPDPKPTPTFGGGDSGGAGASDSWSSSSSSDTSSSCDSSSSSCDSSSSGGSD